ncbi:SGNH/GDSL hydrolase family protein [Pseudonocardia sp. N23]|uniref:SGNH/GDSL hydrolase family protein n=1 Tax=Pseudonocardia sp. N23 TaxID=1987376 RepID=UPI000BFBB8D9|nr:SGNH/GDSL hydrolase family protein [Pseudonocardia sp. N23]GAY12702.1 lipolytic enzyme, G-D-S-L precursor [Pseudonocardia sp. N23]
MALQEFEYDNLTGRPPGRLVSVASRILPGVREVQDQTVPFALAWQQHNRAAIAADGPLWVALGDSMTVGLGAPSHDRGWVGQVAATLPMRVVNLAMSGARVPDVLERQIPALRSLGEAALVTLMIGSNDLMNREHRLRLPDGMRRLLDALPAGSVVSDQPGNSPAALGVNTLIADAVRDRGLVLADMRGPRTASWRGRLAADHFHPNEAGYAAIAAVFGDAIDQSLRGSREL